MKCKYLRILNSSQSFQEHVMFSSCNDTVRERKKTLDTAVPEQLPLDILFHLNHDQVHDEVNMCTL